MQTISNSSMSSIVEDNKEPHLLSIRFVNFMCLKDVTIDFVGSHIISLCGYNDSGKSAIIRGLEIFFYDAYSTKQNKYIRTDEDEFQIVGIFSDGVRICKIKYATGQSVWEFWQGDKLLYTNRTQNGKGIVAVTGVPDVIAKYFNVQKDDITGEMLNIRRVTDKLFLLDTTGGENYKALNSLSQAECLAIASMRLTESINKALTNSLKYKSAYDMHVSERREHAVLIPPEDVEEQLKANINTLKSDICRYRDILGVCTQRNEVESYNTWGELEPYDPTRFTMITEIKNAKSVMDEVIQPELKILDLDRVPLLTEIMTAREDCAKPVQPEVGVVDLERINLLIALFEASKEKMIGVQPECQIIDYRQLSDIKDVCKAYNDYWTVENEVNQLDAKIVEAERTLAIEAKANNCKICPNCHTVIQ